MGKVGRIPSAEMASTGLAGAVGGDVVVVAVAVVVVVVVVATGAASIAVETAGSVLVVGERGAGGTKGSGGGGGGGANGGRGGMLPVGCPRASVAVAVVVARFLRNMGR
jgi:hypothetical protein